MDVVNDVTCMRQNIITCVRFYDRTLSTDLTLSTDFVHWGGGGGGGGAILLRRQFIRLSSNFQQREKFECTDHIEISTSDLTKVSPKNSGSIAKLLPDKESRAPD